MLWLFLATGFFAQDFLVCDTPILTFLPLLGWQIHATIPRYWFKWGLVNFLPGLALNSDPPDLSLPSS
jgi:hypothetical protein